MLKICIEYYLAHTNRRNFILHREELMGNTITDTEKLSLSKHKSIKQWSKYATKNTKAGGDEVIMTRTIEKVSNKMSQRLSELQAEHDNQPNDDPSINIPPITPSMIPSFNIPPIPKIPTDLQQIPPALPPPVQQPIKDQATKPQIVSSSNNIQPQYIQIPSNQQYIHSAPKQITTVPVQSVPVQSVQSVPVQSLPIQSVNIQSVPAQSHQVQYPQQYIQTMVHQPNQYIHHQTVPVVYPQVQPQVQAPVQPQAQPQPQQQTIQSYQPSHINSSVAVNYRYHPYQSK